jgi:hypothetical protein
MRPCERQSLLRPFLLSWALFVWYSQAAPPDLIGGPVNTGDGMSTPSRWSAGDKNSRPGGIEKIYPESTSSLRSGRLGHTLPQNVLCYMSKVCVPLSNARKELLCRPKLDLLQLHLSHPRSTRSLRSQRSPATTRSLSLSALRSCGTHPIGRRGLPPSSGRLQIEFGATDVMFSPEGSSLPVIRIHLTPWHRPFSD